VDVDAPHLELVPMNKWSEGQVLEFIQLAGFGMFVGNFEQNNVDGELLTKLTRATLKTELGIDSLGARDKFLKVKPAHALAY
jgi:hypothetical protein